MTRSTTLARATAAMMLLASATLVHAQRPQPRTRPRPAAPAKPAAPPKMERSVPFGPGEALSFDVSWSSYLTAGTATLKVLEKKPSYGSQAYYVVAEGRPTPLLSRLYSVYYKVDSLVDAFSLLPQRGSVYSEEGRRHRLKVTMFDQPKRQAQYEVQSATIVRRTIPIPAYAQDPLSALYVLRAISLKPGDRMTMPICDAGHAYKAQIQVAGAETVRTPAGDVPSMRVNVAVPSESGARALVLWISSDARHLPVKLQAQLPVGSFVLTLRAAG